MSNLDACGGNWYVFCGGSDDYSVGITDKGEAQIAKKPPTPKTVTATFNGNGGKTADGKEADTGEISCHE